MPIYEYRCSDCGANFEELVLSRNTESVRCPQCSSTEVRRKPSVFGLKVQGGASTSSCAACAGGTCSTCK
ncbi:MAG TPA: zinc ribbon domain-containing protein [Candidatus Latescibacteria bacterium]|nr:zinc ribbon domain-containing protein [Candidatus Latescibacterota bacterium]